MGLGDEAELAIFVREEGRIVAGVSGWTWGDACELTSLWVDPSLRGRWLGPRLLAAAEAEAAARGCTQTVHLTYDFQARRLYEWAGYELVGRVEALPAGADVLWYRKRLDASGRWCGGRPHDSVEEARDDRRISTLRSSTHDGNGNSSHGAAVSPHQGARHPPAAVRVACARLPEQTALYRRNEGRHHLVDHPDARLPGVTSGVRWRMLPPGCAGFGTACLGDANGRAWLTARHT